MIVPICRAVRAPDAVRPLRLRRPRGADAVPQYFCAIVDDTTAAAIKTAAFLREFANVSVLSALGTPVAAIRINATFAEWWAPRDGWTCRPAFESARRKCHCGRSAFARFASNGETDFACQELAVTWGGEAALDWVSGTIFGTGSGWAWRPAKENENRGLGRMRGGAARSRLAMEQAKPSNCLIRSVRD